MIKDEELQLVLDRVSILDVVKDYAQGVRGNGYKYECCCPFHSERTPSFKIDVQNDLWYCHGACQEGGGVIKFVMKAEGCTFPEAVRVLAKRANVTLDETTEAETAEERSRRLKRESMLVINEQVSQFYASQLWAGTEETKAALAYAEKIRGWNADYLKSEGIGMAPRGNVLLKWARESGLNIELMTEMGLFKEGDGGKLYDFYRDRLIIPQRSRARQVIGFTSRLLNEAKYKELKEEGKIDRVPAKYVNSCESECYSKDNSVFGIDKAVKTAVKDGLFYLVEGAPDVMRMQVIGASNAIASLGGAWTENQLKQLARYNVRLCFIPDCDPVKPGERWGAGTTNVMKNGAAAVRMGFAVTVKEIPMSDEAGEKRDPDSYITSKAILGTLDEVDFLEWYAKKVFAGVSTVPERTKLIKEIAELAACIKDRTTADTIIENLARTHGYRKAWTAEVSAARKDKRERDKAKQRKVVDADLYEKYGFFEDHNCYYAWGKDTQNQWSNFTMKPLYHILDPIYPKRLFLIKNAAGAEQYVELKQSELTSLARFQERVEGLGNYIWLAKQEQLNKLKMFLYEQTETAREITQLGWQREGFWAWGNGVYHNGDWIEADDFGIIRLDIGNFYLPSTSKVYAGERMLFQFERKFTHVTFSTVTLRKFTDMMFAAWGDNARVGFCYLLATLFRDVITSVTKVFPLLNLFGQSGSGKSELGHSLMSFFIIDNTPINLSAVTDAALAASVAQVANALVHLDEYKNDIDKERREALKGLFDGTGRSRMNMDRDKKREQTLVDAGIILSGQEMPTIDIALFTRTLYLTFNSATFSAKGIEQFNELRRVRRLGCTHLTHQILEHRKRFEMEFYANYMAAKADIMASQERERVDGRLIETWSIPLAAYRTLESVLDVDITYKQMYSICREMMHRQQREKHSNDELAMFWNAVDVMHQQGVAVLGSSYRIEYEIQVRGKFNGKPFSQEFRERRPILYMNHKLLVAQYQKYAKAQGDTVVPPGTLYNYLEVSQEYLCKKGSCAFYMTGNMYEATTQETGPDGSVRTERTRVINQAYAFDYIALVEKFGINLEVGGAEDAKDFDTETKIPI